MKKFYSLIAILFIQAINILYAQTDWHITGNTGTNSSTNFIGTTDKTALQLRTNNAMRMTISSSGNVGIGTTKPLDLFHVNGTGNLARFGNGTTSATYNYWYTGNDIGSYIEQQGNTTTAGSDKFRIQSSKNGNNSDYSQFFIDPVNGFSFFSGGTANGNVGIGTMSPANKLSVVGNSDFSGNVGVGDPDLANYKFYVVDRRGLINYPVVYIENPQGSSGANGMFIKAGSNIATGANYIAFLRPDGTNTGLIQQTSLNGVTYASTSDKRLKNIIGTSQKGLADLMKIKIYDYTFKSDPEKKVQTGFMAQELYEIFPQAVSKPRETNEPAEKNPWMVDYGRVTPLIIKAVQELSHQNDELKSEIQKLKSEMQKQIDELKALLISKSKENTIALN